MNGNYSYIKCDFEKLLVAKANLKVMVFQGYNHSIPDLLTKLEEGVRAFQKRSSHEIYILAAYNNDLSKFEFRQITDA